MLQSQHATCKSQYAEDEKYSSRDIIVIRTSYPSWACWINWTLLYQLFTWSCYRTHDPQWNCIPMANLQKIIILGSQKSSRDNFVDLKANQYLRLVQTRLRPATRQPLLTEPLGDSQLGGGFKLNIKICFAPGAVCLPTYTPIIQLPHNYFKQDWQE